MLSVSEESNAAKSPHSVPPFQINSDTAVKLHVNTQLIKIWFK